MPYLRFSRDERGYEHTYLLHGLRTGSRPRLLYWFRTPPNVSIGRLPLDEDAIHAIEDANSDLTFDWVRMLRVKPKAAPVRAEDSAARRPRSGDAARRRRPRPGPEPVASAEPLDIPAADEAGGADSGGEPEAPVAPAQGHPVAALVGDDGLARLRAQYAELRARLTESRAEPRQRERMAARVEALNPDTWRGGEEAVVGIERFEAEVAAVRAALGRRRRRASRGRRGAPETPAAEQADDGGDAASD